MLLPNPKHNKYVYAVESHTKTHKERFVPIIPQAQNILDVMKSLSPCHKTNDYIFFEDESYMTTRSINSMLEYACEHIGIEPKRCLLYTSSFFVNRFCFSEAIQFISDLPAFCVPDTVWYRKFLSFLCIQIP